MEIRIITYRDIFQYEAGKKGRYTDEYKKLSAQIILDKGDMAHMGIKDGEKVLVENDVGKIVVAARQSDDDPHPGMAFMINSPWSNHLVRDDICETDVAKTDIPKTSIPEFKNIVANISPSGGDVTGISELLERMMA